MLRLFSGRCLPTVTASAVIMLLLGMTMLYAQAPDTAGESFMKRLNQELAPASAGQDSPAPAVAAPVASTNIITLLLRVVGYLGLVLLVIAAITWFIRRSRQAARGRPGGGAMDLLEVLPLGQGRNLLLVRVSDRVFLLGQTPEQISKIDGFDGEKAVELITASKGGGILQFKDAFNNFMSKMVRKPS